MKQVWIVCCAVVGAWLMGGQCESADPSHVGNGWSRYPYSHPRRYPFAYHTRYPFSYFRRYPFGFYGPESSYPFSSVDNRIREHRDSWRGGPRPWQPPGGHPAAESPMMIVPIPDAAPLPNDLSQRFPGVQFQPYTGLWLGDAPGKRIYGP